MLSNVAWLSMHFWPYGFICTHWRNFVLHPRHLGYFFCAGCGLESHPLGIGRPTLSDILYATSLLGRQLRFNESQFRPEEHKMRFKDIQNWPTNLQKTYTKVINKIHANTRSTAIEGLASIHPSRILMHLYVSICPLSRIHIVVFDTCVAMKGWTSEEYSKRNIWIALCSYKSV